MSAGMRRDDINLLNSSSSPSARSFGQNVERSMRCLRGEGRRIIHGGDRGIETPALRETERASGPAWKKASGVAGSAMATKQISISRAEGGVAPSHEVRDSGRHQIPAARSVGMPIGSV